MESRYDADAAARLVAKLAPFVSEALALRTYTARLIGSEPSLVLHGGGNTSVKTTAMTLFGEPIEVLHVKGSGWDLATIEPPGHPAVRLAPLQQLRALDAMTDEAMVNELRTNLLDAAAPNPSVETLLHALLPARFIDHTHAHDAVRAGSRLGAVRDAGVCAGQAVHRGVRRGGRAQRAQRDGAREARPFHVGRLGAGELRADDRSGDARPGVRHRARPERHRTHVRAAGGRGDGSPSAPSRSLCEARRREARARTHRAHAVDVRDPHLPRATGRERNRLEGMRDAGPRPSHEAR